MGQYYQVGLYNCSKNQKRIISISGGIKLTEHSWIGNYFMNAISKIILNHPHRIVWCGDYVEQTEVLVNDELFKDDCMLEYLKQNNILFTRDEVWDESKEESIEPVENFWYEGMVLVNHSKKQWLPMEEYIRANTYEKGCMKGECLHPLSLLNALGNGRGLGDYYDNHNGEENVGYWAFDIVEFMFIKDFENMPERNDYITKIIPAFREDYQ